VRHARYSFDAIPAELLHAQTLGTAAGASWAVATSGDVASGVVYPSMKLKVASSKDQKSGFDDMDGEIPF